MYVVNSRALSNLEISFQKNITLNIELNYLFKIKPNTFNILFKMIIEQVLTKKRLSSLINNSILAFLCFIFSKLILKAKV